MAISKTRPTAPDVKQGPSDRRRKTGTKTPKVQKAVDTAPALTIVSSQPNPEPMVAPTPQPSQTPESPAQEPNMTDEQTPDSTPNGHRTVVFTLEKITKYGTVIYRSVGLGTATYTKTEFNGAPPQTISCTGPFRSEASMKPSEVEKSQKRLEMIQNRLKKDQEEAKDLEEKLKAAGIEAPVAVEPAAV